MNKRFLLIIFGSLLLMSGIFFTAFSSRKPLTPETQVSVKSPVFHEESPSTPPSKDLSPAKANAASFSLKEMSKILFQHTVTGGKLEDLVKDLKKTRQEPFLVRDKNDETGEMIIVRTKSPLPGTRYFHAQYFTDETMQAFAQHMSFELHASPQAMNQAIQTVKEAFPNLDAPSEESRDFIQWDLEDGYVIWIKRLGAEDIQENPFNFYSAEDIGSIRIAVELAPEGD